MKSDKSLAISGISEITSFAIFETSHATPANNSMKTPRRIAPPIACGAIALSPAHKYKIPTIAASNIAIAAAPPIADFASISLNFDKTIPRTAIIAVITARPAMDPNPKLFVLFIIFIATIRAVNSNVIPATALKADLVSKSLSIYKTVPRTTIIAVIVIKGANFISTDRKDRIIIANIPIKTPRATVGAIRLFGSSNDKIPKAVAITPIATVITINVPTDLVTSLDDFTIKANMPIKTPRAIVGAIKLLGSIMDNAAIEAAITPTHIAMATIVPFTSEASFVAFTNPSINTERIAMTAKPCNNSKGSI